MKNKKYDGLNGLRTIAMLGILIMHVQSNGKYNINNTIVENILSMAPSFVFLFMTISGFSMCCGYYEKFKTGEINIEEFYKKRFKKVWPFFACLCILDLIMTRNLTSLYETVANLTLMFGFIPNHNITIIGVGWFIGLIFVFYLLFPFFVFLLSNKKRAWFSFFIMIILNIICNCYFFDTNHVLSNFSPRQNIVYSSMYFMSGGLIYLYKENIIKYLAKFKFLVLIIIYLLLILYFQFGFNEFIILLLSTLMVIYAIMVNKKFILINPVTKFLSNISLEIYLCHMVIFRGLELFGITQIFKNVYMQFIVSTIFTIVGAIVLSLIINILIEKASHILENIRNKVMKEDIKDENTIG